MLRKKNQEKSWKIHQTLSLKRELIFPSIIVQSTVYRQTQKGKKIEREKKFLKCMVYTLQWIILQESLSVYEKGDIQSG